MACDGLITADILYDCDNPAIAGLETDVVLVMRDDINYDTLVVNASNKLLIDTFQLKSGKTGYLLQGVKQINSTLVELVQKETGPDKKKHTFNGFILTPSVANKLQLEYMSEGKEIVAIVNKKWKGTSNADAFEIYGLDSGLYLSTVTYNSAENDGAIGFSLANLDGFEEPKFPVTLLDTDYATTLALFENKFIQA